MRSKSPELMSEIKKYIEDYYLQNRQSPSTTKIAEAVGIARGTAYKYLVEMAEKNMRKKILKNMYHFLLLFSAKEISLY